MGACCTTKQEHFYLDYSLPADNQSKKILLLGGANAGKTTILRQLEYLHSANPEVVNIKNTILQNCIDTIIIICEIQNDKETIASLQELSINNSAHISKICNIIFNKWSESDTKIKYKYRFHYGYDGYVMKNNLEPFLDQIEQIMDDKYTPTRQDIFNAETDSSVVKQISIKMRNIDFHIYDIPYAAKKEAINYFQHTTTVIFVASLIDYCIYDKEEKMNAMKISLKLFEEVCNSRWFKRTHMILFLNKCNLFRKCVEYGISMRYCFEELDDTFLGDYGNERLPLVVPQFVRMIDRTLPTDVIELIITYVQTSNGFDLDDCYEESVRYIKNQFQSRNQNPKEKLIYTHLTVANNQQNIEQVFLDVNHIIIERSLLHGS